MTDRRERAAQGLRELDQMCERVENTALKLRVMAAQMDADARDDGALGSFAAAELRDAIYTRASVLLERVQDRPKGGV